MKLIAVLGGLAAAVVFFFAVIFAMASSYVGLTAQVAQGRAITSGILFLVGIVIVAAVYYVTRKPKTVVQRLELSGVMKAAQIKCPNCGGSISSDQIQISAGVPYVKCPYCGTTFEVAEEPKW